MVVQKNTHRLPNYAEEEPKYHVADLSSSEEFSVSGTSSKELSVSVEKWKIDKSFCNEDVLPLYS
jgi:hypothetical protein